MLFVLILQINYLVADQVLGNVSGLAHSNITHRTVIKQRLYMRSYTLQFRSRCHLKPQSQKMSFCKDLYHVMSCNSTPVIMTDNLFNMLTSAYCINAALMATR